MSDDALLPLDRFVATLATVAREGEHLSWSRERLYAQPVDVNWVRELEHAPLLAERLEAFVARFGRMQDTMSGKLLPRWLLALAEEPGTQIESLNRAERLGVVTSTERWLEARKLRNRLVHEYAVRPEAFAADLVLAEGYSLMLFETFDRILEFAAHRMEIDRDRLPSPLAAPPGAH